MIELNPLLPGFDMSTEVLCSLSHADLMQCVKAKPDRPEGTSLSVLAEDFGLANQHQVRRLIDEAQRKHRVIVLHWVHETEGHVCAIASDHWRKAKAACTDYWQHVYKREAVYA